MKYKLTNEDKEIIRLWDEGYTGSQIANEVGKTRNAIMGKIYRLRRHRVMTPVSVDVKKHNPVKFVLVPKEKPEAPKRAIKEPRPAPPKEPSPFAILDVLSGQCRYIVSGTSSRDYVFCANKQDKRSYCQEHYNLCYVPSVPKRDRHHNYKQPVPQIGTRFYDDPA
jgi:hypothetical protein